MLLDTTHFTKDLRNFEIRFEFESDVPIRIRFESDVPTDRQTELETDRNFVDFLTITA